MKVAALLFSFISFSAFAGLQTECVITRVGGSFNQTKFEVNVSTDAKRYTQAKGQLVVHLIENQEDRIISETELIKFSRRVRTGKPRNVRGSVSGLRADTCEVYFSGYQRDR